MNFKEGKRGNIAGFRGSKGKWENDALMKYKQRKQYQESMNLRAGSLRR